MIGRFTLRDVRLAWESIEPAIVQIKTDLKQDWRPHDIYAQCLMGKAFCYTCDDGFVVVKPQENQFSLARELFVWICFSTAADGLSEYNDDIRLIAQDIHATAIIFGSPREGFRKLAKMNGWSSMTEYKIPVN